MSKDSEQIAVLSEKVDKLEKTCEDIVTSMDSLSDQMTKYKGFVGGIIFAFTAVGTLISMWIKFK